MEEFGVVVARGSSTCVGGLVIIHGFLSSFICFMITIIIFFFWWGGGGGSVKHVQICILAFMYFFLGIDIIIVELVLLSVRLCIHLHDWLFSFLCTLPTIYLFTFILLS